MHLLKTALANGAIARVLAVWALSQLGTWAFTILLSLHAYEVGGAGALGAAVAIRTLPGALAAPYAAVLADRHSRRVVLLGGVVARGLLLAGIGVAVLTGLPFAAVLALAAAFTIAGVAHAPAQTALLPALARTPAELAAANVGVTTLEYAAFLAGSALAGAGAGILGLDVALLVAAAPFALAAGTLLLDPPDARPALLPGEEPEPALAELLGGVRAVRADRRLQVLTGIFAVDMLVQGLVDVLLVLAAIELLGLGDEGVGWLNAAWGVGGLIGGAVALALLGRGALARGLVWGCVLAGVPFALVGVLGNGPSALVFLVLLGIGLAVAGVALSTFTQRLVAEDALGRVFGLQETILVGGMALGSVLAAAAVELAGLEATIIATGLVLPLVALALRRPLLDLEASVAVPERPFALLRSLAIFAPLPVATVENLALRAEVLDVPAGAAIIEQGTDGDRFYVVDAGTVEVTVGGATIREQHAGDFFGEIALLHRTTRTATVRAATPVRVLALDHDDFLAALGAHVRSTRVAHVVAAERLDHAVAPA